MLRHSASIREFLQSTDIHGVRFLADRRIPLLRRALWLLVVLASTAGLVFLIVLRVKFYFTYPSFYNSLIHSNYMPAPGLVFCPQHPHKIILPREDKIQNMSDTDLAYLLHVGLDLNIMVSEKGSSLYTLSTDWMDFFTNLSLTEDHNVVREKLYSAPSGSPWFSHNLGNISTVIKIIERIKQMNRTLEINADESYLDFLKTYGLNQQSIVQCKLGVGAMEYDCKEYWKKMVLYSISCMALDGNNGTQLMFANQGKGKGNYLHISLKQTPNKYAINSGSSSVGIFIYDYDDFPDYEFIVYQLNDHLQFGQEYPLEISRAYKSKLLDKPYGKDRCVQQRYSQCIKRCEIDNRSCKLLAYPNTESVRNKKWCTIFETGWDATLRADCQTTCTEFCEQMSFKLVWRNNFEKKSTDITSLYLLLPPHTAYEEYIQERMYSEGALIAEIGGYVGLFLGASLLSLYHILEYTLLRFTAECKMRYCNKKTDVNMITGSKFGVQNTMESSTTVKHKHTQEVINDN